MTDEDLAPESPFRNDNDSLKIQTPGIHRGGFRRMKIAQ
jgi:hypothetical protein